MNSTTRLKSLLCLLSSFGLGACAATACPQTSIALHPWSAQEQNQAAEEISRLPDNSIHPSFMEDYARLRREAQ